MNDAITALRFSLKNKMAFCLLCPLILLYAAQASALFNDGKIDSNFSYRSLRLEPIQSKKKKEKGCYLTGEIVNNTAIPQENISITFYAFDYFDHFLWKQKVHVDYLEPASRNGKRVLFRQKMRQCDPPDKLQFKVSGVKGKDPKHAFPEKSISEKSVSSDRWEKEIVSAEVHAEPRKSSRSSQNPDHSISKGETADGPPVTLARNYMVILKNGKEIVTDSCREQGDVVYFNQEGGEVQIRKEKVAEIRKLH